MAYTQDDFQKWLFLIEVKMAYFTGEFAQRYQLTLDYSLASLDELESWILTNYATLDQLLADREILDYLTLYIGETFRKHIGGKWSIDLEDKKNPFYAIPILTDPSYRGGIRAPMTYATACIHRKKGNSISTILKNDLEDW